MQEDAGGCNRERKQKSAGNLIEGGVNIFEGVVAETAYQSEREEVGEKDSGDAPEADDIKAYHGHEAFACGKIERETVWK